VRPMKIVIGLVILVAVILGGQAYLRYRERASWRERTESGKRFTRAEELERGEHPDLAEALLYYDLSLPGIHGAFEERVHERSNELVSRLKLERPGFFHQDSLLSERHETEHLFGAEGQAVGLMELRETFSRREVHFLPAVARAGDTTFPGELTDRTVVLVLPRDDADVVAPVRTRYRFPKGSVLVGTQLEFAAVPTTVDFDAPQTETNLTGVRGTRIHVIGAQPH
jgi:hypothetical protein